ncbi:MAG: (2Fe-2S)-binding protein [Betaproteobacteria bacterium]|nr:(2Fe-2S)-binding protein [Betaproteobacteria bacterium]
MDELTPITLTVNGEDRPVRVGVLRTLAQVLREELELTGTKVMCGEGECGSCTVLIDGRPTLSCLTLAVECEGRDILTIEGLAERASGSLHPLQRAFVEHSGMQCAVCTPGMVLTAKALLDEKSAVPSEDEVRQALAGNLCRCGNYKRIVESVLAAARAMKGGA